MGLLNDLGTWLADMQQSAAGVSVSYARIAGGSAISLTAWVGRSASTMTVEGNIRRTQWGERDYLIQATDLTVSGSVVEPRIGDRLTESINSASQVFEITQPPSGEPGWRWADPGRTMYRLHVKRVS